MIYFYFVVAKLWGNFASHSAKLMFELGNRSSKFNQLCGDCNMLMCVVDVCILEAV